MSPPLTMHVRAESDRLWAAGAARRFAAALGFSPLEQARLSVCVAELASNAARHAGAGQIELTAIEGPPAGCRLRVEDEGPGIEAVDEALLDGFSEGRWLTPDSLARGRRGLGVGLGAVRRLMSEVRLSARVGGGLVVEALLWKAPRGVGQIEEERTCRKP